MGMDLERTHGQSTVSYGGITAVSHKGVVFNCAKKLQQKLCHEKHTAAPQYFSMSLCTCNSNKIYCYTRSIFIKYQYQKGGPPFLRVLGQ